MNVLRKLDFTEKQKKEYRKLKKVTVSVGVPGLVAGVVLRLLGFLQISDLIISAVLFFLSFYVYAKYRKILSISKSTIAYSKFQKEIYAKVFKLFGLFLVPYYLLVIYLIVFQTKLLIQNPILIVLLILIPAIIFGVWAMLYEWRRFGALMRAP